MNENLIVRPDKNMFLLYTVLNALGQARGSVDSHFLRRKTVDHFQNYVGLGLNQIEYMHLSKAVAYVLTLEDAPSFKPKSLLSLEPGMKSEINIGSAVHHDIIHFHAMTDFPSFYDTILSRYTEECDFLQGVLDRLELVNILDEIWGREASLPMEVIPMPLEATLSGVGPSIDGVSYQIVGPPFDYTLVPLVAHEASHPRAKRVLANVADAIAKHEDLFAQARNTPNYPKAYGNWSICFEEHFIRAMQIGYINPLLDSAYDVAKNLQKEKNTRGMVFLHEFYEGIKTYKDDPTGKLEDAALVVLERLDAHRS